MDELREALLQILGVLAGPIAWDEDVSQKRFERLRRIEAICNAALAARPVPAEGAQARRDVNDLCEAISRIRWARGTGKLDAAIFEAVRIQSIVDASHAAAASPVTAAPANKESK
jgi:hypothetical protein